MTATLETPAVKLSPQDVALYNLSRLMEAEGKQRKDLAAYLGMVPQNISRLLSSKHALRLNDICRAAEFVGVPLEVLLRDDLTQVDYAEYAAQALASERHDEGNGGLPVVDVDDLRRQAGHGWPRGYWMLAA
ncbi:helix-turn-helix transcriptional regulator [Bifidobacterium sp. MA2]|uniref:Helix-turn-helix transcriptional regulator n=1 Tax=Bifidobacterium santillanense TaxID=2809028 RepID=A0ABS5US86_9BIFI|nr:helix-turn-helix transcriptional regulator [Bifidobacterium santillanense]MBT1173874.1 helix-turn-helix transcriptional regulator [Bifidobacterium santillanense]